MIVPSDFLVQFSVRRCMHWTAGGNHWNSLSDQPSPQHTFTFSLVEPRVTQPVGVMQLYKK